MWNPRDFKRCQTILLDIQWDKVGQITNVKHSSNADFSVIAFVALCSLRVYLKCLYWFLSSFRNAVLDKLKLLSQFRLSAMTTMSAVNEIVTN